MKKSILYILLVGGTFLVTCSKSEFLDVKPDQAMIVPEKLEDFQAILDNDRLMNGSPTGTGSYSGSLPSVVQAGSDEVIITDYFYSFATTYFPYALWPYHWSDDYYSDGVNNYSEVYYAWSYPYRIVFQANLVLDGIQKLKISNGQKDAFDNVKGSALFYRAYSFYGLAQAFTVPFDKATASSDSGLPLRMKSDLNEKLTRSSVLETYNKIVADLKEAETLLPDLPAFKTRPSKTAVRALLAKVYLTMMDYENAWFYANGALTLQSELIDFNTLNNSLSYPFNSLNKEVIFQGTTGPTSLSGIYYVVIDTNLYKSYAQNDLRRALYFADATPLGNKGVYFKGSYNHDETLFSGLATDEMYLVRAECYARKLDAANAIKDLNTLMIKRWKNDGSFIPFTIGSPAQALELILTERKKELMMRGTRWSDLRRLNKEGANIVLKRVINGTVYELQPNSKKYAFMIPNDILKYNPGWKQNPR